MPVFAASVEAGAILVLVVVRSWQPCKWSEAADAFTSVAHRALVGCALAAILAERLFPRIRRACGSRWVLRDADCQGLLVGSTALPLALAAATDGGSSGYDSARLPTASLHFAAAVVCVVLTLSLFLSSAAWCQFFPGRRLSKALILALAAACPVVCASAMPALVKYSVCTVTLYAAALCIFLQEISKCFTVGEAMLVAQATSTAIVDLSVRLTSCVLDSDTAAALQLHTLAAYPDATDLRSMVEAVLEVGLLSTLVAGLLAFGALPPRQPQKQSARLSAPAIVYFYLRLSSAVVLTALGARVLLGRHFVPWLLELIVNDSGHCLVLVYWACALLFGIWAIGVPSSTTVLTIHRKLYHLLALMLFVPVLLLRPLFLQLALGIALALGLLLEFMRASLAPPLAEVLQSFVRANIDERDSGLFVLTHLYLLAGCAAPMWLSGYTGRCASDGGESPLHVMSAGAGIVAVGVGDAAGAVVGIMLGRTRWPQSRKTLEGSAAMFLSMLGAMLMLACLEPGCSSATSSLSLAPSRVSMAVQASLGSLCVTLIEAGTTQIDNVVLPLYLFASLAPSVQW